MKATRRLHEAGQRLIEAMFYRKKINITEQWAVSHVATRPCGHADFGYAPFLSR